MTSAALHCISSPPMLLPSPGSRLYPPVPVLPCTCACRKGSSKRDPELYIPPCPRPRPPVPLHTTGRAAPSPGANKEGPSPQIVVPCSRPTAMMAVHCADTPITPCRIHAHDLPYLLPHWVQSSYRCFLCTSMCACVLVCGMCLFPGF
eukprot:EG_transcript_12130